MKSEKSEKPTPPHEVKRIITRLDEYQEMALRGALTVDNRDARLIYGAMLLDSEASDVSVRLRKQIFEGATKDTIKMLEKLGDTLRAVAYITRAIGYNLSDVARYNVEKQEQLHSKEFKEGAAIREEDIANFGNETDEYASNSDPED
jgi:hypothetical protein